MYMIVQLVPKYARLLAKEFYGPLFSTASVCSITSKLDPSDSALLWRTGSCTIFRVVSNSVQTDKHYRDCSH